MKNKKIIRVLFVDDDTILCKMVKMSLEKNGYEVDCLFNLDNIEETIQNMQPNIIVMDIGFERGDGIEVLEKIKRISPTTPILFESSHLEAEEVVRALDAGGLAYLKKPFDVKELIAYINRYTIIQSSTKIVHFNRIDYDIVNGWLLDNGKIYVQLTLFENMILKKLASNINNVTNREDLMGDLWSNTDDYNEFSVNNSIMKIRKYLSTDPSICITTIYRKGYILHFHDLQS